MMYKDFCHRVGRQAGAIMLEFLNREKSIDYKDGMLTTRYLRGLNQIDNIVLNDELKQIKGSLKRVGEFRNMCVHGRRGNQLDNGFLQTKTGFKEDGVEITFTRITSTDLDDIIKELYNLALKLEVFQEKYEQAILGSIILSS